MKSTPVSIWVTLWPDVSSLQVAKLAIIALRVTGACQTASAANSVAALEEKVHQLNLNLGYYY